MIFHLSQYYIKHFRPRFIGMLTRLIYSGKRVSFGRGFRTDSIPRIIVDRNCQLKFGNRIELRRNVEIRAHGASNIHIENDVRIDRGVRILAANNSQLKIGAGTRIGLYCVLNGGDDIQIGKKVLISGFVYLQTSMHQFQAGTPIQEQGFSHKSIVLEDDVWLGTHVVVLPGCKLGEGTVAGSSSVVTESFKRLSVIAGIPARPLKERK